MPTALVFSTTENSTVPAASVVRAVTSNSGPSFSSVTVTVTSCSPVASRPPVPAVAWTVMRYVLESSAVPPFGSSKSGADLKVMTPAPEM